MSRFEGIPAGRLAFTSVPNVLFSEWLPAAQEVSEVKVALHIFFLLSQKKGNPRYVTYEELREDTTLMRSLSFQVERLKRGLEEAVAHGVLLRAEADGAAWYLFNTPESRRALEKLNNGELAIAGTARAVSPDVQATPNIFRFYEQEIGVLTPIIADELKEAEAEYPPEVILNAFRIAAENNARSWKYVSKILLDWTRTNKHEKTRRPSSRERRPGITGKLAGVAKSK
jgi:DnaD/phage-associated family protein